MLQKYVSDKSHVFSFNSVVLGSNSSFVEEPYSYIEWVGLHAEDQGDYLCVDEDEAPFSLRGGLRDGVRHAYFQSFIYFTLCLMDINFSGG